MTTEQSEKIKVKLPPLEIEVNPKHWAEFMKEIEGNPEVIARWITYNFEGFLDQGFAEDRDGDFSWWVISESRKMLRSQKE